MSMFILVDNHWRLQLEISNYKLTIEMRYVCIIKYADMFFCLFTNDGITGSTASSIRHNRKHCGCSVIVRAVSLSEVRPCYNAYLMSSCIERQ